MSAAERSGAEAQTNYKTAIWSIALAAVGLLTLVVAGLSGWFDNAIPVRTVLSEIGGLLFVSAALTAFWDLRGKRDLINEVLTRVQTSSEVRSAGLTGVTMDWNQVPFAEYLKSARDVSVFIAYGSSWRKVHWTALMELAGKKGHSLRLYLPDPNDQATVAILSQRFDYELEKTARLINEMAQEIATLYRPGGADIRIYFRTGDPTYTLYKFDERIVVSLYANRRARGNVPMFTLGEGSMYAFFDSDLAAIAKQSVAVPLADLTSGVQP